MRFVKAIPILLAAAIGCAPTAVQEQAPISANVQLWNKGRIVYRMRCISCHNADPNLKGSVGPALRGVSEELLRDRLANGKLGMPAFPRLINLAPALREYLR